MTSKHGMGWKTGEDWMEAVAILREPRNRTRRGIRAVEMRAVKCEGAEARMM